MLKRWFAGASILVLIFTTLNSRAQEFRGTIRGLVTDTSGAVVQNAIITAVGPTLTYKAHSGTDGVFTIPFVQPATYKVVIEAHGFKSEVRPSVLVDINSRIDLNVVLQVGATAETVTVTAGSGLTLDTDDASGGTIMDPDKVQGLPLNGRQIYMLLSLTPGVQFTTTQFGASGNSGTRGWDESDAYAINGQTTHETFSLNGASISQQNGKNQGYGTWNIAPNVDAIEEFKVMSNTYDAQYGRYIGGTVNTIIKSGTKQYHGTVFDFWRNSVLDANTFTLNQQNEAKSFHNEHQFGGTFGGAITPHNRNTFFFFSFEGWREALPGGVVATVPTADMLPDTNGNVNLSGYIAAVGNKGIYDPATVRCAVANQSPCNKYIRNPFPNWTIPASRISPTALKILALLPKPNRAGYTSNYVFNGSDSYRYNQPIIRVDHTFSDSTKMYGMFAWWSGREYRNKNGYSGAAIQGNIDNYRSSLTQVIDVTHTVNSNLFGDFRISFNRAWNESPDGTVAAGLDTLTAADLGLSMPSIPTTSRNWAPEINTGQFGTIIGNTADPIIYETYDASPSLTQIIKRHTLHYGLEVMLFHDVASGVGQPNGTFTFGTGYTYQYPNNSNSDGLAIADMLLGYPDSGSVQDQTAPYESYKDYAAYIQDDWKIRHNLTLNAGLRWETETSPVERHNRLMAGICLTCKNPITDEISFPGGNTLANGATMVNPIVGTVQFASNNLTAYENNFGTLQPRVGFSWALGNKMVIRGGWGLNVAGGIELGGATPWSQSTSYNASADNGITPTEYFNQGKPFPNGYTAVQGSSAGDLTFVGTAMTSVDQRNRKFPVTQNFSFGLEGHLPFGIIGDLEYVGVHTIDLRTSRQMNSLTDDEITKGLANAGYLTQTVPNPFYGVLSKSVSEGANPTIGAAYLMVPYPQFYGNLYINTHADGYNNYNSMIAKAEKRFSNGGTLSKGLSFLSSFTWAKLMSATGYLNNTARWKVDDKPSYHLDSSDNAPAWQIAFSGLYGIPMGSGGLLLPTAHGLVGQIVDDWQLEWIFQNRAGTPIGIPTNYLFNCGSYNVRPQNKSWSSYLNNSQSSCWTNEPQYFLYTHDGTQTKVRNPWAQQTQLGLQKKFALGDELKLLFKAEAFNLTNTAIFGSPSTSTPTVAPYRVASVVNASQPGAWAGYGTVGSTQQNFPRQVQFSLKLQF